MDTDDSSTIEFANILFRDVCLNKDFQKLSPENKWEQIQQRYPDFVRCYPVIVMKMVEGIYSSKCFRLWLEKLRKDPGSGMDGVCERQADYARMLFKMTTKGWTPEQAKGVWKIYYDKMKEETDRITNAEKDARDELDHEKEEMLNERRNEIYEFLLTNSGRE